MERRPFSRPYGPGGKCVLSRPDSVTAAEARDIASLRRTISSTTCAIGAVASFTMAFFGILLRLMPSPDEFPFRWVSAAPLVVRSLIKPPIQGVKVDFEDENLVK